MESRWGASGASGLTRCHTLRKVELILSSMYHLGKLLRFVSYISETIVVAIKGGIEDRGIKGEQNR